MGKSLDDFRAASEFENDDWAIDGEPMLTIAECMSLSGIEYCEPTNGFFYMGEW
jgi:hypothetical protein